METKKATKNDIFLWNVSDANMNTEFTEANVTAWLDAGRGGSDVEERDFFGVAGEGSPDLCELKEGDSTVDENSLNFVSEFDDEEESRAGDSRDERGKEERDKIDGSGRSLLGSDDVEEIFCSVIPRPDVEDEVAELRALIDGKIKSLRIEVSNCLKLMTQSDQLPAAALMGSSLQMSHNGGK